MRTFFHHVGDKGSSSDFPKTLYKNILITEIQDSIPEENSGKYHLISQLNAAFPDGKMNCWGVPYKAHRVINNLNVGDLVLLVKSLHMPGEIPAMCIVKVFVKFKLPELSYTLWGDEKYPYIFFFKTEEINLTWLELTDYLNYASNYDPRGTFCFVAENKLKRWGGSYGFYEYLQKRHIKVYTPNLSFNKVNEPIQDNRLITNIAYDIEEASDSTIRNESVIYRILRDTSLSSQIKRLYNNRCQLCDNYLENDNKTKMYSEVHHIKPLGQPHNGPDIINNMLCVCPNCHAKLDFGFIKLEKMKINYCDQHEINDEFVNYHNNVIYK